MGSGEFEFDAEQSQVLMAPSCVWTVPSQSNNDIAVSHDHLMYCIILAPEYSSTCHAPGSPHAVPTTHHQALRRFTQSSVAKAHIIR
jgi:hypothetical protein